MASEKSVRERPESVEFMRAGLSYEDNLPVVVVDTFGCSCCSNRIEIHNLENIGPILDAMEERAKKQLEFVRQARNKNAQVGYNRFVEWLENRG